MARSEQDQARVRADRTLASAEDLISALSELEYTIERVEAPGLNPDLKREIGQFERQLDQMVEEVLALVDRIDEGHFDVEAPEFPCGTYTISDLVSWAGGTLYLRRVFQTNKQALDRLLEIRQRMSEILLERHEAVLLPTSEEITDWVDSRWEASNA